MSEELLPVPLSPDWRDNLFAQQVAAEIGTLQGELFNSGGVKSYLEIGCSFGWTLGVVAQTMKPGGRIRGIDFGYIDEVTTPENALGFSTKKELNERVEQLRQRGLDVEIFYGDSHSLEAIKWARDNGPYQLVGIDGDHSYEGVRADWENYAHLGSCVWLHDIANKKLGVMQLWQELSSKYNGCTREIVYPMGIGIVNRLGPPMVEQTND